MPLALNQTVSLYWESTAEGAPVLCVMGLGMNATGWWRTVPVLAAAPSIALNRCAACESPNRTAVGFTSFVP